MNRQHIVVAATAALGLLAGSFGCQEVEQPSPVLTEKQWDKVKKHIYDYAHNEDPPDDADDPQQAPEPEYKIGANYQDKIEFIGFSVGNPDKNEPLIPGEPTTFKWYWRAKEDIDKNWEIFVHFDSKDSSVDPAKRRQNLDHDPLDGLFPTSKWPKGKIVEDVQEVTLRGDYPGGPAVPYVGFYRGKTRLSIENDVPKTNDNRVKAPSLQVSQSGSAQSGEESSQPDKPTYRVAAPGEEALSEVTVDGKLEESVWKDAPSLTLSPFGAAPEMKSEVRVVRSDSHLFFGAHLDDKNVWSTKEERDSNTWEEEVIEIFVDVDGDGSNYLELQINPLGTIFDANFKKRLGSAEGNRREQIDRAKKFNLEGLEHAVHVEGTPNDDSDEDKYWSVEWKVPLTSLPGIDDAGNLKGPWAVNLYRFERPDGKDGKRTLSYAWNTAARGDFHQVDKFGTFELGSDESGGGEESGNHELPSNENLLEQVQQPPGANLPAGAGESPPSPTEQQGGEDQN